MENDIRRISIRIPVELHERMRRAENLEAAEQNRTTSLHAWILDAIQAKLNKEQHNG